MLDRYRIRSMITRRRNMYIVRLATIAAEKLIRTVRNHTNFGMNWNGERTALELVHRRFPGPLLDVGAHQGRWTKMALEVAPGEDVHCFEISPDNVPLLREAVRDLPNVTVNEYGLAAARREVVVYHNVEGGNLTSYVLLPYQMAMKPIPSRVIPGDDYVEEKHLKNISFIKIDVEGAEMDVLQGLSRTISAGTVAAVQFEHGTMHVVTRHFLKDFIDFFEARDYVVCRMWPEGIEPVVYNFERDEEFVGQNFVAVRRDVLEP